MGNPTLMRLMHDISAFMLSFIFEQLDLSKCAKDRGYVNEPRLVMAANHVFDRMLNLSSSFRKSEGNRRLDVQNS